MKTFELISQQGNIYGLRLNNGIVYAEANTPYEAFEKSYKALQSTKVEYDSSIKPIKTLDVPKTRVKYFDFNVDFSTKKLTDSEVTFTFYATAYDQFLRPIEVEYQRNITQKEIGVYEAKATALNVTKTITFVVEEKKDIPTLNERVSEQEDVLFDIASDVAMLKLSKEVL